MPRRLNFTNRRKILRSDVKIRIVERNGGLEFDADLRLARYELDSSASVHIEAHRSVSTLWKRFDFGTVGNVGPQNGCSLDEFERPDGIRFRVKIASSGDSLGRLLAEADSIRPKQPDESDQDNDPIIDVDCRDLGDEVWRVEFDGDMPVLLINEKIEDWKNFAREPVFRSLVTPLVMRMILTQMLLYDEGLGDEEDETDWRQRWKRFAEGLLGGDECPGVFDEERPDEPAREEVESWIDRAVQSFSSRSGLLTKLIEIRANGGN